MRPIWNSTVERWEHVFTLWQTGGSVLRLEITANLIVGLCTAAIAIAVVNNFLHAKNDGSVTREKKSIVETGTMTLFFIFYYLLVRNGVGVINIIPLPLRLGLLAIGTFTVILGCIVNIIGRRNLGGNWGNQILIYKDHTIVTGGVYKLVRHPLYASLIWMFYGASMIYANLAACLANTFIFLPFMCYRAKQEEAMLIREFPAYEAYCRKTGMFLPLLWRRSD